MPGRISVIVTSNGYLLQEQNGVLVAAGSYASGVFEQFTPATPITDLEIGTIYRATATVTPETADVTMDMISAAGQSLYTGAVWGSPTNQRLAFDAITLDMPLEIETVDTALQTTGTVSRNDTGGLTVQPGGAQVPVAGLAQIAGTDTATSSGSTGGSETLETLEPLDYTARLQIGKVQHDFVAQAFTTLSGIVGEGPRTDFTSETHYLDFNFGPELQALMRTGDRAQFDRLIGTLGDMGEGWIDEQFARGAENAAALRDASRLTDAAVTALVTERARIIADITVGRDVNTQPLTEAELLEVETRLEPYARVMLTAVESFNNEQPVDIGALNAQPHVLIGVAREMIANMPAGEERDQQVEALLAQLGTSLPADMPIAARDAVTQMVRDAITSEDPALAARITTFLEGRDISKLGEDMPETLRFLRDYVQMVPATEPQLRAARAASVAAAVPAFLGDTVPEALAPVVASMIEEALVAEDTAMLDQLIELTEGDISAMPPQELLPLVALWARNGETAVERQERSDQLVAAAPAILEQIPENLRTAMQPVVEDVLRNAHFLAEDELALLAGFSFAEDKVNIPAALELVEDVYLREPLNDIAGLPVALSAELDMAKAQAVAERFEQPLPEPLDAESYAVWYEEVKKRAMAECASRAETVSSAISAASGNIPEFLRPFIGPILSFLEEMFPGVVAPGTAEAFLLSEEYADGEAVSERLMAEADADNGAAGEADSATSSDETRTAHGLYEAVKTGAPVEALVTPVVTQFAVASGSDQVAAAVIYTATQAPEYQATLKAVLALDPETFNHSDPALVLATLEGLKLREDMNGEALDALIANYQLLQSNAIGEEQYLAEVRDHAAEIQALGAVVEPEAAGTETPLVTQSNAAGVDFAIVTSDGQPATREQQQEALMFFSMLGYNLAGSQVALQDMTPALLLQNPHLLPDGARLEGNGVGGEYKIILASGSEIPFDSIEIPQGLTAMQMASGAGAAYDALGQQMVAEASAQQPANDFTTIDYAITASSFLENQEGQAYSERVSYEMPIANDSLTVDGGTGLETVNLESASIHNADYLSRVLGRNIGPEEAQEWNKWFGYQMPWLDGPVAMAAVSPAELSRLPAPYIAGVERERTTSLPAMAA